MYPQRLKVTVTPELAAKAVAERTSGCLNSRTCVIAQAVREALGLDEYGGKRFVSVGMEKAKVFSNSNMEAVYRVSKTAQKLIEEYDNTEPSQFSLKEPVSFVFEKTYED